MTAKEAGKAGKVDSEGGEPFTETNLHFLRSLRISVAGEEDNDDTP